MHKQLVSVIIPVYNVEKYLGECLESITSQTYKNLEIICVNDGTTDQSEEIIDKYIKKDQRIKKINQKNKGLNLAREAGFKNSTGSYITFVDSDDALHPKAIETVLNSIVESGSDISVFGYKKFIHSVSEIRPRVTLISKVLIGSEEILRYMLVNDPAYVHNTLQLTVCGKLYKRFVIDRVNWQNSNYRQHEDLFWTPVAFSSAKKVSLNMSDLYFYRRDPNREVLSRAVTGNSLNKKPVGYLELVHEFASLVEKILADANLKNGLKREFEDAVYGMYKGNFNDLVEKDLLMSENNVDFIPEYDEYSQRHIKNLATSLDAQDRQIKNMGAQTRNLEKMLDPKYASVKDIANVLVNTIKHRIALKFHKRSRT